MKLVLTSGFVQVYWLIISTIWGTIHIFQTRDSVEMDKNEWTFGQILPIVLLIAPLFALAEHLYTGKSSQMC